MCVYVCLTDMWVMLSLTGLLPTFQETVVGAVDTLRMFRAMYKGRGKSNYTQVKLVRDLLGIE